jgi:DMSO reductase anchor subunit
MINSLAATVAGGAAIAAGLAGIYCSARIYLVPARPAWNSGYTVSEFFLTACLLGPLLVRTVELRHSYALGIVAAGAGCAGLFNQIAKLLWLARAEEGSENRVSATLLLHRLRGAFLCRVGLLMAGGVALPLATPDTRIAWLALLLALAGETIGRWLFFIGVTPKSVAATFVPSGRAA